MGERSASVNVFTRGRAGQVPVDEATFSVRALHVRFEASLPARWGS